MIVDVEALNQLLIAGGIFTAMIIGLVQVFKKSTRFPTRYLPLVSLALGILVGIFFMQMSMLGLAAGIIIGLTATGAFVTTTKPFGK